MAIGTFPGVMELPVLRICVCWKVGVRGGGGGEVVSSVFSQKPSTVDVTLALSDFNN